MKMDGFRDNKQLREFGLQVQQLLGSELSGFVNINNLKYWMKDAFGFDVDERASTFGYDSFEDMLNSNILNDYVEIEKERIGEGGQVQTRYKARHDKNTITVHRAQVVFQREKERREEKKQRRMEQHFEATLYKPPPEELGTASDGGRGFRHYDAASQQRQQSQNGHHFRHRRAHSPLMEMNGALDSNWYTAEDNNEAKAVERDNDSDSDDTSAKIMVDYMDFYGARKCCSNSDNTKLAAEPTTATTTKQHQPQKQQEQPSKVGGGVLEWSSDDQQQPNEAAEEEAKQQRQKQQHRTLTKSKFVGIGWQKIDQTRQQQQKQTQNEPSVSVVQKTVKLINISSEDEEDERRTNVSDGADRRMAQKSANNALASQQTKNPSPASSVIRPIQKKPAPSVSDLKRIIWSEDEDEPVGSKGESSINGEDNEETNRRMQQPTVIVASHIQQQSTSFDNNSNPIARSVASCSSNVVPPPFFHHSAPCPPVDSNPAHWSADTLCQWLTAAGFVDSAQRLLNEEVDGASLLLFSPIHYQNLGLKLGPMVKLQQMVEYLRQFTDVRCSKQ